MLLQAAPDYFLAVRSLGWLSLLAAAALGLLRLLVAAAGWLLAAPGCCWLSWLRLALVAAGCGSPGCSWLSSWLLLALLAAGCRLSWLQLALLLAAPGCWLLLADPDHEIQDFDQFLLEKLKVFCQSPFEPSTLRGVFEGDINSDCIFTRNSGCHDFAPDPSTANRPYTRPSEPLS